MTGQATGCGAHSAVEQIVRDTLARCASSSEGLGHGRWYLSAADPANPPLFVAVDDAWLLCDAAWPDGGSLCDGTEAPATEVPHWDLLRRSAGLPGGTKLALSPESPTVRLRAEWPLEGDADLASRVKTTVATMRAALGAPAGARGVADAVADGTPCVSAQGLASLCREAGWPATERADGSIGIELDVPGGFHQAVACPRPGGVCVVVELTTRTASPSVTSQEALGVLLLRVNGIVRMARAVVDDAARLQVVCAEKPSIAELAHACAALSVACRVCAREAEALAADDALATAYLEVAMHDREGSGA